MQEKIAQLQNEIEKASGEDKLKLYLELIDAYRTNSNSDKITETLIKASAILPEVKDRFLKSNYYYKYGILSIYNSNYPEAQKNLLRAYHNLNRLEGEEVDIYRTKTLLAIGVAKQKQGLFQRSLIVLMKAEFYSEKLADKTNYARLQNWQAICYSALGQHDKALELNFKALDFFLENDEKEWISNIYNSLALIFLRMNDDKKALQYFEKAQEINIAIGHRMGEANVLNNLGMIHRNKKEYKKALEYYLKAVEIREKYVGKIMLSGTYSNIAAIYYDLKNYEKSLAAAKTGLAISQKGNDYEDSFENLMIMAYNFTDLCQYEEAENCLEQMEELCEKLKSKNIKKRKYEFYTYYYETRKDYTQALKYQKLLNEVENDITSAKLDSQNKLIQNVHERNKRKQISSIYKEKHRELAKANDELRKSLQRLELTNHILRHDLLNHLSVIYSAMRTYNSCSDAKYLEHIHKRTKDAIDLIHSLSELPNLTTEKGSQNTMLLDLNKILKVIMAGYVQVEYTISGQAKIKVSKKMKSVLTNLVDNAVRHGKTSTIEFEIEDSEAQTIIRIKDNGKGIDSEIADRIFQKNFHYGETGHTGLGLYIAREVVAEHGGKITYIPNKPQGSIFEIEINKQ